MRSALERRQQMLEYLSDHRFTTYSELASEFGISQRTAMRDIEELTCSAPIYTVQGNGGGIRVADGWYISRTSACFLLHTIHHFAADTRSKPLYWGFR